jgi:beta-glucanase (GH16 family)
MAKYFVPSIVLSILCTQALWAADAPVPTPTPEPLFAPTPPLKLSASDFPDAKALNDDAAGELKGLCSLEEFRALPAEDRHVYSFDVWPSAEEKLGKKAYTFNFQFGGKDLRSQKVAFLPTGGGPNSNATFARVKDEASGRYRLAGLGNLDWSGKTQHTFKFDKPVAAFGIVLNSSDNVALRKFYWAAAKEMNGFPISYTLADGTIVNLGERDVQGALIKGNTESFLGVIDRSGRGIVSVNYTLGGLAGNKAQGLSVSNLAFATMPKPAVAPVVNLLSSCDFEAPDLIAQSPTPKLDGLATLDEFRFIVPNKRSVYRFNTWPKTSKDLGGKTGEFSFDLRGKGVAGQKMTVKAENSANNARLSQASLKDADGLPYPVLGGLGNIGKTAWAEQTFTFEKPVWAFGVTYRSGQDAQLAGSADGKSVPVSYTLSDGTIVPLGAGAPASVLSKSGKTFVGMIDKTDKGISSVTLRVQGTAPTAQPLYIEDLAFAMSGPPPGDWKLVVNDNFDGDALNPEVWAPGYIFKDVINNEYQGFVPENITVANGVCTIKVERRDCFNMDREGNKGPAQKFASGAFTSFGKFTPTYGYFEARVKMPKARGAGVWPAFWMLPDRGKEYPRDIRTNYRSKKYGTGIEIDIFEFMPRWKRADGLFPVHMGCIWSYGKVTEQDPAPHGYGAYALENDGWGPKELYFPNLDTEFHTYGLYWSPERLIFYIDSKPVFRVKDPKHVPDVPHYFLFNISLSGNGWGKSPDKSNPKMEEIIADMPNSMEIDYFRAYSGTLDEAIPASPTDNPAIIRKYAPPAPGEAAPTAPAPAAAPSPTPTDSAPSAPINSTIDSPSNG